MKLADPIHRVATCVLITLLATSVALAQSNKASAKDDKTVKAEHGMIGAGPEKATEHTDHPDAQWFPDAAFGLFLHWDISSVRAMNISWPMIPGRALSTKRIDDPAERERIIRDQDWNLKGTKPEITPLEYWEQAKQFNPQNFDPEKWMKAAKAAGFKYVVLTTKHHGGFALWPSKYGNFNTKTYMGGRDLVKEYVEACRKNGLKVGLYFSGPDWHFDQDYFSFLYHGARKTNPEFPNLGPDLKPRQEKHSKEEIEKHQAEYAAMVKGQVEELLTNYGKIDLLWFDGKPSIEGGDKAITLERIRELQPGIVVNPRMHGKGDFITYERNLKTDKIATTWAEFCNTWAGNWSYVEQPMKANGYVLGELARARSLGVNYLLGIGPMKTGDLSPDHYKNMAIVADWMKTNGESIHSARPLPNGESASVPATASASARYLFAIPEFKDKGSYEKDQLPPQDVTLSIKGITKPTAVKLLSDGSTLAFDATGGKVTVQLPAAKRSNLVDVVKIELPETGTDKPAGSTSTD